MLRALQDELTFGAVSRRELPVSTHLPYTRHVDDWIVRTKTGLLMNFIKLDGFSFQNGGLVRDQRQDARTQRSGSHARQQPLRDLFTYHPPRGRAEDPFRSSTMTSAARSTSDTTRASPSGVCSSTTST